MAEQEIVGYDLFGQPIVKQKYLRDDFIEPPFSVLDTKGGNWVNRKEKWKRLGIRSEVGRNSVVLACGTDTYRAISKKEGYNNRENYVSIFDPVLCELMYKWFVPEGGTILDPFAVAPSVALSPTTSAITTQELNYAKSKLTATANKQWKFVR